jgi:hypothetical protein
LKNLTVREVHKAILFALFGIPLGLLPVYVYFIVRKKGFRWLWLGYIFQTVLLVMLMVFLFGAIFPNIPQKTLDNIPYVNRITELSRSQQLGTAKVRLLIWQGADNILRADAFRTIVGYGPETMKYIWGAHAPPEIAYHEARNSIPDRSHNEIFDILVINGIVGFIAYIFLLVSIFYYGLKWLGFISTKNQRALFIVLSILGAFSGLLIPRLLKGTYILSGICVPAGIFTGLFLYLAFNIRKFFLTEDSNGVLKDRLILLAFLSAIIAHLIEIQFGISIASTRMYFFVYAAACVLLGMKWIDAEKRVDFSHDGVNISPQQVLKNKKTRHKLKKEKQQTPPDNKQTKLLFFLIPYTPLLTWIFITALIFITMGFELITNPFHKTGILSIIWSSLTTVRKIGGLGTSYSFLLIFLIIFLVGVLFLVVQNRGDGSINHKHKKWWKFLSLYCFPKVVLLLSGCILHEIGRAHV